jgi:hypothetical protein
VAIATNVQNIAKGVGAAIDTAATIRTKALTAAQFIYGQVVGKSTGGLKAFRIALAATGVGIFVIALGELITNFDGVNKRLDKITNGVDDFITRISGGSKVLKAIFTAIAVFLGGPIAPLILLIKLIDDFGGTINQLQNFINGVVDEIAGFTDKIAILGTVVRTMQNGFNVIVDSVKSLDSSTSKFKVNLETLTKVYERHNEEIEKNKKAIDDQIAVAKAQGVSEDKLAKLTRQSLEATSKGREIAYNKAVEIANKLIQQNGKLTDDQQKQFDKVQSDYQNSQLEVQVFDADQLRQQRERWKAARDEKKSQLEELVRMQLDFNLKLRNLQVAAILDEEEREQAALKLQVETEINAINEQLKNLKGTEEDKQRVIDEATLVKKALLSKYYTDAEAITKKFDDQELERQKNSFAGKAEAISNQVAQDTLFAEATIRDAKKLEEEKLKIKLKGLQDQLALAKAFFEEDGKLTKEELNALSHIQDIVDQTSQKLTDMQNQPKLIEGLGMTQNDLDQMSFAAEQITTILNTISSVINADAERRKKQIDEEYKQEVAAIENSTLSQEEKEEKIQGLNKKTAIEKYNIEKSQFEANQAFQIINTTIAGAVAAVQAFAQLGPIAGGVAAAVIAGVTIAQIGIIAGATPPEKPQFYHGGFFNDDAGGYTGDGDPRQSSTALGNKRYGYHYKEHITPWKVLQRPEAWPHVQALEGIRLNTPGSLGLAGFADGGFHSRQLNGAALNTVELSNSISFELSKQLKGLKFYTKIDDISSSLKEADNNVINSKIV